MPYHEEKEFTNVRDFFDFFVEGKGGIINPMDETRRYYFRGQANKDWPLIPKLARKESLRDYYREKGTKITIRNNLKAKNFIELQKELLGRIRRYTSHDYADFYQNAKFANDWEWLCIAQHNNLPTLLLDWTLNPLIAMFFATNDYHNYDSDAAFFAMKLKPKADRKKMSTYVGAEEIEMSTTKHPILTIPLVFTKRIESQTSRFIYSGHLNNINIHEFWAKGDKSEFDLCHADKKNIPWEDKIIKFIIPKGDKRLIMRQLAACQIHEGTVFQGIHGYAKHLRKGGL
jgi:hypothetical protein